MADVYLGTIIAVPYSFAPAGWQMCDGTLLSIAENEALFTLIGTTYGGDGQNSFAVPDLRARMTLHAGAGTGLANYALGQSGGSESVTLNGNQNGMHNHTIAAQSGTGTGANPSQSFFAASGVKQFAASGPSTTGSLLSPVGGNQPHENRMPLLAMYYVIATQGVYPSPA